MTVNPGTMSTEIVYQRERINPKEGWVLLQGRTKAVDIDSVEEFTANNYQGDEVVIKSDPNDQVTLEISTGWQKPDQHVQGAIPFNWNKELEVQLHRTKKFGSAAEFKAQYAPEVSGGAWMINKKITFGDSKKIDEALAAIEAESPGKAITAKTWPFEKMLGTSYEVYGKDTDSDGGYDQIAVQNLHGALVFTLHG